MHKADIEKLEDFIINYEKYKKDLKFRELELEDTVKETIPQSKVNNDLQDPRTIRASSNTSTVETKVTKLHADPKYQMLYSIVCGVPKFLNSCNKVERFIIEYRYHEKDLTFCYDWEDIAYQLNIILKEDNKDKTISKTTVLRSRNNMLERLADHVGYPLI